jgi:hypothetical protein
MQFNAKSFDHITKALLLQLYRLSQEYRLGLELLSHEPDESITAYMLTLGTILTLAQCVAFLVDLKSFPMENKYSVRYDSKSTGSAVILIILH